MRSARRRVPLVFVLVALAGCAAGPDRPAPPAASTGAAPAAAVDWSGAERVDVALTDFDFTPRHLVLEHGRPYRLHLVNQGSAGHNFDAPAFFQAASLRDDTAARLRADRGAIEVAKGETADLYLVPGPAGTYPLECSHLLHAAIFGMTGDIEVR